jgi:hyperosmotically inducible protein
MNARFAASCLFAGTLLLPIAGFAADADHSSAKEYVKDSVITTKVKTLLAEEKMASLVHVTVDTDNSGAVTLGGTAATQNAIDRAVAITRTVKGVTSVNNHITVAPPAK